MLPPAATRLPDGPMRRCHTASRSQGHCAPGRYQRRLTIRCATARPAWQHRRRPYRRFRCVKREGGHSRGVIAERDGRVPFGLAVSAMVDGAGWRGRSFEIRGPERGRVPGGGSSITRSWLAGARGKGPRRQLSFSGHGWMLRRAASRMSCASMPARDSAMPNAGHSQTNSSGPAGGSGHVHHREMNECGPPPPANGYSTGPAGSASWSGLPPPGAGCGQVTRPAGQVLLGVAGAGPDPRGHEDLDPGGKG